MPPSVNLAITTWSTTCMACATAPAFTAASAFSRTIPNTRSCTNPPWRAVNCIATAPDHFPPVILLRKAPLTRWRTAIRNISSRACRPMPSFGCAWPITSKNIFSMVARLRPSPAARDCWPAATKSILQLWPNLLAGATPSQQLRSRAIINGSQR